MLYNKGMFGPEYYHYNTDYLGNNRDVISDFGNVVQRTEYSAFGTPFPQTIGDAGAQPYKYGGKEFDHMHGLDWYDFHARMQDPLLHRFHMVDPMTEKYYSVSPYAYCANNPVRFVDPDGMDIYLMTSDGAMVLALKTKDKTDQLFAFNYDKNKMESITIEDQGLLPQLQNSTATEGEAHYGATSNKNDAFNAFKFVADNTSVEWALYKNEGKYTLGTKYDSGKVNSWEGFGIKKTPSVAIHSHPSVDPNQRSEEISMGYLASYKKGEAFPIGPSDWTRVREDVDNHGKQTESKYVYFPNSKQLYHVYYNGPMLIRNVENNYKKLMNIFK